MKCEQGWGGVISWLVVADGMKQNLFSGQLKFNQICSKDATIACCKVVVAASSHCRSPGSITRKSQIQTAKQTPIWGSATISLAGKLINFDIVTLCKKATGAEAECLILSFGGLGVYLLTSGWR